jgi:hypothetical protein
LAEILEKDVEDNNNILLECVNTVTQCIKRLEEITLRPNPFSTPEYINLISEFELREKCLGYKDKIDSLEKLFSLFGPGGFLLNKREFTDPSASICVHTLFAFFALHRVNGITRYNSRQGYLSTVSCFIFLVDCENVVS